MDDDVNDHPDDLDPDDLDPDDLDENAFDDDIEARDSDDDRRRAGARYDGVQNAGPHDDADSTDTSGVGDRSASGLRRLVTIAVVLTVVAVGAIAWINLRSDDALPDDAVMRVDGTVVTEDQFARRIELLSALYGVQIPSDVESEDFDRFRRDSAKSVAVGMLLEAAAQDRGIEVADRAAADSLARYIEQQYPVGGRDEFIRQLGNAGATEAEVQAEFRRTLLTQSLYNDVVEEVVIADADLQAEYDARLADLAIPETRQISHLVVSTESAAQAAKARIDAGETFAAVASELSLDGATAANGGDLGTITRSVLDPAFGDPAFTTDVGVVFGPIQTDLGWYLGVVGEIVPARTPSLSEIADALRARIRLERELEQWRQFLVGVIADGEVTYADDYRPADPDAPPPVVLPDPLSASTSASTIPSATPPTTTGN